MKNLSFFMVFLIIISIGMIANIKDERPVIVGGTATTGIIVDNDATHSREPYYPDYPSQRRDRYSYYDKHTGKKYYYDRDPRRRYARTVRKPYHGRIYDNMRPESDDILPVRPAYLK